MARSIKAIVADMERLRKKLYDTRDELRDILGEVRVLEDVASGAVENLGDAIDQLSEEV
jgi:hypothetical protein